MCLFDSILVLTFDVYLKTFGMMDSSFFFFATTIPVKCKKKYRLKFLYFKPQYLPSIHMTGHMLCHFFSFHFIPQYPEIRIVTVLPLSIHMMNFLVLFFTSPLFLSVVFYFTFFSSLAAFFCPLDIISLFFPSPAPFFSRWILFHFFFQYWPLFFVCSISIHFFSLFFFILLFFFLCVLQDRSGMSIGTTGLLLWTEAPLSRMRRLVSSSGPSPSSGDHTKMPTRKKS